MTEQHPHSYYAATAAPRVSRLPLDGDLSCEVCVVGGGYTGLSAALHLAEQGRDVVLLEGQEIGSGASGRNGGQIVSGFSTDLTSIADRMGWEAARRLWALAESAKRLLAETISRHAIACDLSYGYLFAALKPRHMRDLAAESAAWERMNYRQARLVDRDELAGMIASPLYIGGLYDAGGGHLNPLAYARGLAQAAETRGAAVFEGTPVRALRRSPWLSLECDGGKVRARHVVVCHSDLAALLPEAGGRVMPVTTHMIATEPLGETCAQGLLPGNIAVSDCNAILDYFRLSADTRLLFGGGASYWRAGGEPAGFLMRRLRKVFPQLDDVAAEWVWEGQVAVTASRLPYVGRIGDNLWWATGFSGQGVALTGLVGKLVADAIAGDRQGFDFLAALRHARFPGGPFRAPLLALAMAWHRLQDAL